MQAKVRTNAEVPAPVRPSSRSADPHQPTESMPHHEDASNDGRHILFPAPTLCTEVRDVLKPCGCSVNVLCCCGGHDRAAAAAARAAATRSISRLTSAAVQVSASTSSHKPGLRTARCGTVGQLEATCQFVLLPAPSRELEGGRVELLERGRAARDGDGRASSRRELARGRTRWRRARIGSWAHRGGGPAATYR